MMMKENNQLEGMKMERYPNCPLCGVSQEPESAYDNDGPIKVDGGCVPGEGVTVCVATWICNDCGHVFETEAGDG